MDTLEFAPSETQVESEIDQQLNNMRTQLAQQGIGFDLYCQMLNTTEEKLREEARGAAVVAIKMQTTIEQIAYTEKLEATDADINQLVEAIARQNRMTVEQLQANIDANFSTAVVRSVLADKVMKLVREAAEIEEIET